MNLNKENIDNEKWLPVIGYEDWYEVSNFGRLKREATGKGTFSGRILGCTADKDGYRIAALSVEGIAKKVRVHRVVIASFIGLCPSGMNVNHKDGDKTNNHIENLEYVTQSENNIHALNMGLRIAPRGENHCHSKLTEKDVHEIRRLIFRNESNASIAMRFNIAKCTVINISHGRRWGWLKEEDTTNK